MIKIQIQTLLIISIILTYCSINGKVIVPNGCGSGKFIINKGLDEVGEASLIECCNNHDICYGECNGKTKCDYEFKACLVIACSKLPALRRQFCNLDTEGMFLAVRAFGKKFYQCSRNIRSGL
jgi:heterodisulfide reductase subunit A-like polyferredoxin